MEDRGASEAADSIAGPASPEAQLRKLRRQLTSQSTMSARNTSMRGGGLRLPGSIRIDSFARSSDSDAESRPLLEAMSSMGMSQRLSAAAMMATSVSPAAMQADLALENSADGLPDSMTLLQKHTLIVRERRAARHRKYWRSVRIQCYFVLSVATIAFVVRYFKARGRRAWHVLWLPVVDWIVLLAALIPAYHLACFLATAAISVAEALAACMELDDVHYVIFGITPALRRLAAAVLLSGGFMLEFHMRSADEPEKAHELVRRLGVCVIVLATVDLAKLLVCRILSLRVNSEHLFETMRDAIEKETTLNLMMRRQHAHGDAENEERIDAIAAQRGLPADLVPNYLSDLYTLAVTDANPHQPFTVRLMELCDRFQSLPEEAVLERASHAAEYCWLTLRRDPWAERLTRGDLHAVLGTDELVRSALRTLDVDGDGSVQEGELHQRLQRRYKQRRNLALTLYDNDEVINTMRSLVGAVMHIAACFAYLAIFHVDLNHVVITLSSTGLGLAVIFGNSMRAIYESMVFLFVVRPFQVGDCILYAGERHWVRNFGILTTLLTRFDGCQVWVSNEALMKSEISNLSDSDDVVIRSDFVADAACVTSELCTDLEQRLLDMMMLPGNADYFRVDFKPICNIQQLQEPHKFLMGVCYKIAATGDDYVKVWTGNSRVNEVVSTWQRDHNVIVSAAPTPSGPPAPAAPTPAPTKPAPSAPADE
eukprot:jgi/Ulvmu1/12273/UM087_0007.1